MNKLLSLGLSQVLIVDMQEKLAPAMSESESAIAAAGLIGRAASILGLPITISEQYPEGLGPTLPVISKACSPGARLRQKLHFSCAKDAGLAQRIAELERPQLVICGFEAHVCVLQTAIDFLERGLSVFVAADGVASRRPASKEIALRRLAAAGVGLVTAEMVVFEWLERAGSEHFKALRSLLR